MSSEKLWDEFLDLMESHKELTERLRVACETIEQLKRVNKEWDALWEPIDDLVRPLTPLGESVGDKAVDWIKQGMYYAPFKERDKAYAEWMGSQKTSLKAQIALQGVAKVAHAGGLYGYGDMGDALTRIREITLPYWDKVITND